MAQGTVSPIVPTPAFSRERAQAKETVRPVETLKKCGVPKGFWIETDPRHVREVIKALGLEGASPAPTPGEVAKGETRVEDNEGSIDPELEQEETTMFRAVAARLNFLSQDRPDKTFATMKLCSKMSDAQDLKNMKRVGRFLVGRPRIGCLCEWQAHPSALHALADADWAGDGQSRKSVSGCAGA